MYRGDIRSIQQESGAERRHLYPKSHAKGANGMTGIRDASGVRPITPRAWETISRPSIHDVQKARSLQWVAARAAIERDRSDSSELRTRRCAPACPGCAPTTGTPVARRARPKRTEGNAPWRTERRSRWRAHAPSCRRTGAKRCCGTARHRGSDCALVRTDERRGSCGGAARALLADAAAGGTPAMSPTVRTFARTFLADCAERWKPATRKSYAFNVRRWILPAVGHVASMTLARRTCAFGSTTSRRLTPDRRAGRGRRCRR